MCTLSCCPRERGQAVSAGLCGHCEHDDRKPIGKQGCGGERDFLTSLFPEKDEVYSLFPPFFLEKVMNVGIYGWQQIPHFIRYSEAFAICHPQSPVLHG